MHEMFIDTTDNAIDISNWLGTVTGFVPLIIPITEPAVGYGIGGGLIFFHPTEYQKTAKQGKLNKSGYEAISPTPPSLTGVGGFYTENGSWAAGAGHLGIWKNDHIRYSVGAGLGSVNLDYYGKLFPEIKRQFSTRLWGLTNEISFRIKETDFWVGLGYSFAVMNIEFEKIFDWTDKDLNKIETRNGGFFPSVSYDTRDNIFTPNRGFKVYTKFGYYDIWLGGTEEYQSLSAYFFGYVELAPGHVSGFRVDTKNTFGDPTFIYLPYLVIRGLPAMKYQDKNTVLFEFEQRIKVYNRWSLVAFAGVGKSYPQMSEFVNAALVYTYGTGFRYYLAKKFGLHMGLDFAWGPEDFAFYVTFGSGWLRL